MSQETPFVSALTAEDACAWVRREQRAWLWLSKLEDGDQHRFRDIIRRPRTLQGVADDLGRSIFLQRSEPQNRSEQEHLLRRAAERLGDYKSSFPLADSGAGVTICRIAESDPDLALRALHAYLGSDGFPPPPDTLWHYTTVSALVGILKTQTLWATDTRFLNDSSEILHASRLLGEMLGYEEMPLWELTRPASLEYDTWDIVRRQLPRGSRESIEQLLTRRRIETRIYTTSFCEDENLLSQWRAYGSRQPVAIGFNIDHINEGAASQGGTLHRCLYDSRRQKDEIREKLRPHIQKIFDVAHPNAPLSEQRGEDESNACHEVVRALAPLSPTLKHPDFREEREWRIVFERSVSKLESVHGHESDSGMTPRFHFKLPKPTTPEPLIKAIVLGPGPSQQSTFEALSIELKKLLPELRDLPELRCSSTPYIQ